MRLGGRHPEHPEQILGDGVGGCPVVTGGVALQQSAKTEQDPARDSQRKLRIIDGEPARRDRRFDVTQRTWRQSAVSLGQLAIRMRLSSGRRRKKRPVSRKLAAKVSAGSSIPIVRESSTAP